jgi:hypothetical protein
LKPARPGKFKLEQSRIFSKNLSPRGDELTFRVVGAFGRQAKACLAESLF